MRERERMQPREKGKSRKRIRQGKKRDLFKKRK